MNPPPRPDIDAVVLAPRASLPLMVLLLMVAVVSDRQIPPPKPDRSAILSAVLPLIVEL